MRAEHMLNFIRNCNSAPEQCEMADTKEQWGRFTKQNEPEFGL